MSIRVNTNPVAQAYAARGERIVEYSSPNGGGLISFREVDGRLVVDLYRHDDSVVVRVGGPNGVMQQLGRPPFDYAKGDYTPVTKDPQTLAALHPFTGPDGAPDPERRVIIRITAVEANAITTQTGVSHLVLDQRTGRSVLVEKATTGVWWAWLPHLGDAVRDEHAGAE